MLVEREQLVQLHLEVQPADGCSVREQLISVAEHLAYREPKRLKEEARRGG